MSKKFVPLKVKKVHRETAEAVSISFEKPNDGTFDYLPGQYLTLKLQTPTGEVRRAYSLSSSPYTDTDITVTIKAVKGGWASVFLNAEAKDRDSIEVFPPMGKFYATIDPSRAQHLVLIGGGSGITPLFSILKSALSEEPESRVTLLYGNRDSASIIFAAELKALEKNYPNRLRVIHCLEKPETDWMGLSGYLDSSTLMPILQSIITSDALPKDFFLCGPAGLMDEAKQALNFLTVPRKQIHQELFTAPIPQEGDKEASAEDELKRDTYAVKVILDGKEFNITVKPDQAILDVAIQEGIDPPFACQMGICTTCRAKVLSGGIEMDETEGLTDAEIEDGYILTCQAHPLTPDCVIEYG